MVWRFLKCYKYTDAILNSKRSLRSTQQTFRMLCIDAAIKTVDSNMEMNSMVCYFEYFLAKITETKN